MAILYDTTSDQEREIETMADLRAALPIVPEIPSIWHVQTKVSIITITYGDPDRHHAKIHRATDHGIDHRQTFDAFKAATDRFLALCSHVLA